MEVWIVNTGGYENYVLGIYKSVDSAIRDIKKRFSYPYIVDWSLSNENESSVLTGKFEEVDHYSTKHTARFEIEPMELKG